MAKLHEVLAVEGGLEDTAKKICEEAKNTFTKKPEHFHEFHRRLEMFDDNRNSENTDEHKAMVDTVADKLKYVHGHVTRYLDTIARKEATDQVAKADVVVDGEVLIKDAPATLLLGLESRLKQLREVYDAIPTLQPGIRWVKDETKGEGIWTAADPDERMRTEKQIQHKVLYEATKEHPAQIEKWNADMPIGKITITHWSSMLSPAEKSALLSKLDKLIRAVKRAKQRANTTDVVDFKVGKVLFDFIHG